MLSVGFAFKLDEKLDHANLFKVLENLSQKYGYDIAFDPKNCCEDIQQGVLSMMESLRLDKIGVLLAYDEWQKIKERGQEEPGAEYIAAEIDKDILEWETLNKRPRFFDFLFDVSIVLKGCMSEVVVFFTPDEWGANESVRYEEGYIEDLVILLRSPGGWSIPTRNLSKNYHTSFDAIPLVYKVKLVGEGDKEK